MKVLFDISLACHFSEVTHHGGGDFTKRHLLDMLQYPDSKENLELFSLQKAVLDKDVASVLSEYDVPHHVLESIDELPALVKDRSIDRIYSACANTFRGLRKLPCLGLLTIHGLRLLEKPSDRYEWNVDKRPVQRFRWLLKSAFPRVYRRTIMRDISQLLKIEGGLSIAVDSLHTKYAIARFFPWFDQRKIAVFYPPALERTALPSSEPFSGQGLNDHPFFLTVSSNRWIKNTWRTVHALDQMFSLFSQLPHRVALAGTIDAVSLGKLANPERFIRLGYVSEAELEWLYKEAFCLLYFSLNEGFGYPPLDAMKYGTPVLAGADSSICEVCGSGVIYANPYDMDELINRCLQVCLDPLIVQKTREAGYLRYEEVLKQQKEDQSALFRLLFHEKSEWKEDGVFEK